MEAVLDRVPVQVTPPSSKISDFFCENVFSAETMKDYLSKEALQSVQESIEKGTPVAREMADQIAAGMKSWAIDKGATHYTHWFQPLTGNTAEKHDSFFEANSGGTGIEKFTGDALIQQEPDASSFPSGGLRVTFEARGYTAWDPSSPAFIIESQAGGLATLCVPTVFVSYTGEALDYKVPLLKSLAALDKAAVEVCNYFDRSVSKVNASLGVEQEYFLIDLALYNARPDLYQTGRTLFGHQAAKNQQLDDHYFGSIPRRVHAFMMELEIEALRLGIPVKTRHNEVAPSQFECAPIYEEINLAIDHNQLLMDLMDKVALRHNFKVLLHEKPFAGINGSGKHNNWSMITDTGKNLLSPGKTPKNNLMFLTFFINTIKAVHKHADLLRASIASVGNDHRLGANEAPPAIISIFIGSQLTEALDDIASHRVAKKDKRTDAIRLNIPKIPQIMFDNTDRNRTSPFAFTGNKFELRAVGSSANCAAPMTVLSAIVAEQLIEFKKEVDKLRKKEKRDVAILKVLRQYIKDSKDILFEGDNYSEEWHKEAARRGLPNLRTTPPALDAYMTEKSKKLFMDLDIYTERELEARYEILLEAFALKLQIEGRVLGDLAQNHLIPTALNYQTSLIENIRGLKEIGIDKKYYQSQLEITMEISEHVNMIKKLNDEMVEERKKANKLEDTRKLAGAYDEKIKPYFEKIRYHADKLERTVDDAVWPLPKYRELLFLR